LNCAEVGANGTGFLSEGESALAPGVLVDGKYQVEKLIAVGGMAAVWSGRNIRTDKRVALKVILRSLSSKAEVMARFRREALAAGRIHHPNVVVVFDVVEHEGLTCMVMELLDGEPLIELIQRRGVLQEAEVVALLLPAMRGVEAAHRQGVIHRDLKPHNIFVCRDAEGEVTNTKVLDFGVSKLKEDHPDPQAITVAGTMTGTPAYMAPEQVMGTQTVDPRTDVYAMGIVFFQALAGRPPFEDPSYPALLVRIATEKPASVRRLRPEVSEAMEAVIERAIAKSPEERFPDMGAFIHALESWDKPVEPFERRLRQVAPAEAVRTSVQMVPPVADITARVPASPRRAWWGVAAGGVIGGLCLLLWMLIQDDPVKAPAAGRAVPSAPETITPVETAHLPDTAGPENAAPKAPPDEPRAADPARPAKATEGDTAVAAGTEAAAEHRRRARRQLRSGTGERAPEAVKGGDDGHKQGATSTEVPAALDPSSGQPGLRDRAPRAPRAGNLSPDDF